MPKPTFVVAGHSHAAALGVPPSNGPSAPALISVGHPTASVFAVAGSWPRDDAYWCALVRASSDAAPVIVWDGNQHQAYFLFEPHPPFDFVLSSDPERAIDPDKALVPEAYLRAFIAPSLDPLRVLLEQIAEAGGARAIVCGTPPPKGDQEAIRRLLGSEPHFVASAEAANTSIATARLTDPALMHKLWSLVQDMTREVAESCGSIFVPVPPFACTQDGFLREEHWSGDVTHANAAFGAVMLTEAIGAAEREPSGTSVSA